MRIKIVGFGAVLLLIAAIIFLQSSSAVLFRYKDPAAVDPSDELWVILNPLRDRQPEYFADAFLEKLKKNECEEAVAFVPAERRPDYCAREHEYKLNDWTLLDRKDEPTTTVLHFEVYRFVDRSLVSGNAWVTVEKKNDWRVTSFETWY